MIHQTLICLTPTNTIEGLKAAHCQLVWFLQDHSTRHPLQSGNRKLLSTETVLLHFTEEILKNMDEKRISVVVLLYLTKAFDSIWHNVLLAKLHRIGIFSSVLAWFSSYLSNHKKVVRIGNTLSEKLVLSFGVPQRSIWVQCCSPYMPTSCYLFLITVNHWDTLMILSCFFPCHQTKLPMQFLC